MNNCIPNTAAVYGGVPSISTWTTPTPPVGRDIHKIRETALSYALDFVPEHCHHEQVIAVAVAFENYLLNGFKDNGKTKEVSREETAGNSSLFGE